MSRLSNTSTMTVIKLEAALEKDTKFCSNELKSYKDRLKDLQKKLEDYDWIYFVF